MERSRHPISHQRHLAWALLMTASVLGLSSCNLTGKPDNHQLAAAQEVRHQLPNLPALPPLHFLTLLNQDPNDAVLTLGRFLFNDPILSRNNDTSCATCHLANHGFADGNSLAVGSLGQGGPTGDTVGAKFGQGTLSTRRTLGDDGFGHYGQRFMFRNALSTINVGYRHSRFAGHGLLADGRFGSLEFQVLLPIHTPEELCGSNPVPQVAPDQNPFRAGGPFFPEAITVHHSHKWDRFHGTNQSGFNARPEVIKEIPVKRPNGNPSIPVRNECTALAVAKVRSVGNYRRLAYQAFGTSQITEQHLGKALAAFVMTHVANRTPYDRFVAGDDQALTEEQLLGLMVFNHDFKEAFTFAGKSHQGAGCANCHKPPLFGGKGYASLGVISDPRSALTKPQGVVNAESGFVHRPLGARGRIPRCLIDGITTIGDYAPDIGRANGSFADTDCFKFRIPQLRNVIETYPYFHHGSARGQDTFSLDLKHRALAALKQVIAYHLRGPIDLRFQGKQDINRPFSDLTYQKDYLIPVGYQDFLGNPRLSNGLFPVELSPSENAALLAFVAFGLWDQDSVITGARGNDVSHPQAVPSGFQPTISRDFGQQWERPPLADPLVGH